MDEMAFFAPASVQCLSYMSSTAFLAKIDTTSGMNYHPITFTDIDYI